VAIFDLWRRQKEGRHLYKTWRRGHTYFKTWRRWQHLEGRVTPFLGFDEGLEGGDTWKGGVAPV